jgi:prepilin-type N-terminal cleavage/methylation domain-containing protein
MLSNKGLTLIEVVISMAIFLISVFGIIYLFPRGMRAFGRAREQIQVTNLGQEKMEEIRNTTYSNITPGSLFAAPPYKNNSLSDTTILNEIPVGRTVTVESVDDARDGLGALDRDSNVNDYKKIGIILNWTSRGENHELQLSTTITKR